MGAGAGRLAYDLHMLTAAATTVALDFNPLLAIVAEVAKGCDAVLLALHGAMAVQAPYEDAEASLIRAVRNLHRRPAR